MHEPMDHNLPQDSSIGVRYKNVKLTLYRWWEILVDTPQKWKRPHRFGGEIYSFTYTLQKSES